MAAVLADPLAERAPAAQVHPALGYPAFDADNHYYEAPDCLTRHLPAAFKTRGARWVQMNGKPRMLLGEKLFSFIPNPTFDPIAKPGCLHDYFSGHLERTGNVIELMGELEPIRPEYRDRDARLKVMDAQGLAATCLFPTLAVGLEVAFQPDIEAMLATFSAFNRWLDDDWGLNRGDGRIYAAPVISLSSPEWAVKELEWALERGARIVTMRNGPVYTKEGTTSPAAPEFDPFWARVEAAGVVVAPHAGDDGYDFLANMWEPGASFRIMFNSPMKKLVASQRAVPDFFGALICHRLFERFPRLKVASVENGGGWVRDMLLRLQRGHVQTPGYYRKNPIDQFHEHIWVTPFWEDDVDDLVKYVPVERLLFGSDWPHMEGVAQPLDFLDTIQNLKPEDQRRIMRGNIEALLEGTA
jgi:predicted TIM-barrel fold metal-dependent hydrolase